MFSCSRDLLYCSEWPCNVLPSHLELLIDSSTRIYFKCVLREKFTRIIFLETELLTVSYFKFFILKIYQIPIMYPERFQSHLGLTFFEMSTYFQNMVYCLR